MTVGLYIIVAVLANRHYICFELVGCSSCVRAPSITECLTRENIFVEYDTDKFGV